MVIVSQQKKGHKGLKALRNYVGRVHGTGRRSRAQKGR